MRASPVLCTLLLIAPSLTACGQYVNAEDALQSGGDGGVLDLPAREELASATSLLHYGQEAMLGLHSDTGDYKGGTSRYVDYAAMVDSAEAQLTIADSLANLAAVDPSALDGADEKLAFWLNVYNLNTIQAVVAARTDDPDWGGVSEDDFGMFNTPLAQADGMVFTLNQIEHGIIRGDEWSLENYFSEDQQTERDMAVSWHQELWGGGAIDARIHVGLNCASLGCPDILDGAFRGADLQETLDELARDFANHPGKGAGPDGVSQLFSWFVGDFEGSHGGVAGFIQQYRDGGDGDVDYDSQLEYDWTLNEL